MNILIICDSSGNDDEGMKKISRKIGLQLNQNNKCKVQLASLKEVLFNLKDYENIDIIHSLSGPTFKTFIYVFLIKKMLKNRQIFIAAKSQNIPLARAIKISKKPFSNTVGSAGIMMPWCTKFNNA